MSGERSADQQRAVSVADRWPRSDGWPLAAARSPLGSPEPLTAQAHL